MYKFIIIAVVNLMPLQVIAAERPAAFELLDKYAETHNKFKSFILKYDDAYQAESKIHFLPGREAGRIYKKKGGYIGEVRSDGTREYVSEKRWGSDIGGERRSKASAKSDPRTNETLWDGERRYQYQHSNAGPTRDRLWLVPKGHKEAGGKLINTSRINFLWGFFEDSISRAPFTWIYEELKQVQSISVQEKLEKVDGSECYVINARSKDNRYKMWIDPQHGYNIAQAQVSRGGEGIEFGLPEEVSLSCYLRNVRFRKIDDVWIPIEDDYGYYLKRVKGDFLKEDHHIRITQIELNPDHEALGSLRPDFIRNGTRTQLIGRDGVVYSWQDGKLVDKAGKQLSLDDFSSPSKLFGKPLPQLEGLVLNLSAEQIKNRVILICFFDMNQRPSRNCIEELTKRGAELKEKGVAIVAVQAAQVSEEALDELKKKYNISFPVGIVTANVEQVRYAWGVRSLPWLILMDKQHNFRAEGFSLNELDDKIKGADKSKQ